MATASTIISRLIFVLLLCESLQIALSMLSPEEISMDDRRRQVHNAVKNDPCKRLAPWMDAGVGRQVGNTGCQKVLAYFNGLEPDEKKGCLNAGNAECGYAGFLKESRCTFMCDIESPVMNARPIKIDGKLQRPKKTERKQRLLAIIAAHVINPDNPPTPAEPIDDNLLHNELSATRLGPKRPSSSDDNQKGKRPKY